MTTLDTLSATHLLQELLDRAAITDLVHRLGSCLDEARFDELRALLVADATLRSPGGVVTGIDAIVAQAARIHPAEDRILHAITNVLIEVAGDTASARANLMVSFATRLPTDEPGQPPLLRSIQGQLYRFDFVRRAGGWRIARIETVQVWTSAHLRPAAQP